MKSRIIRWMGAVAIAMACMTGFQAQAAEVAMSSANIHSGNWSAGGGLTFSTTSYSNDDSTTDFTISAPLQYFVWDRVALGLNFALNNSSDKNAGVTTSGTSTSLGPVGTWYFWAQDAIGSFTTVSANWNNTYRGNNYFDLGASVGLNFFITPSVAIGPAFSYRHAFKTSQVLGSNRFAFPVAFSMYF